MSNLKMPKMIIFDYGHTLVYEDTWDGIKGEEALLKHAISNPNALTAEQIGEVADQFYFATDMIRENNIEFHQHQFQRLVYEYLQIEINLPPEKQEEIYWDHAAPGHAMPHIGETLDYLFKNHIRAAVISNISFSGQALENRIKSVLPDHHFEFIMASSEYIFRKPHKTIFELALRKAGLEASEVWYCGDSVHFDIRGAHAAGIFPVWYQSEKECWYRRPEQQDEPGCAHLHIKDWRELVGTIEKIKTMTAAAAI